MAGVSVVVSSRHPLATEWSFLDSFRTPPAHRSAAARADRAPSPIHNSRMRCHIARNQSIPSCFLFNHWATAAAQLPTMVVNMAASSSLARILREAAFWEGEEYGAIQSESVSQWCCLA